MYVCALGRGRTHPPSGVTVRQCVLKPAQPGSLCGKRMRGLIRRETKTGKTGRAETEARFRQGPSPESQETPSLHRSRQRATRAPVRYLRGVWTVDDAWRQPRCTWRRGGPQAQRRGAAQKSRMVPFISDSFPTPS